MRQVPQFNTFRKMRSITLNIGRKVGPHAHLNDALSGVGVMTPEYMLGMVAAAFGNVVRWASHDSDTEPTLVVEVNVAGLSDRMGMPSMDDLEVAEYLIGGDRTDSGRMTTDHGKVRYKAGITRHARLCYWLGQEAIAWHDGLNGHMSGPMADKWGPFNGRYFVCMDGEKLVDADGNERVDHWFAQ